MSLDVASNRTASKQSRTLSLPTDRFDIIKKESTHNQVRQTFQMVIIQTQCCCNTLMYVFS